MKSLVSVESLGYNGLNTILPSIALLVAFNILLCLQQTILLVNVEVPGR